MRMGAGSRPEKLRKTLCKPTRDTMFTFSLEVPEQDWLMDLHPCTEGDKVGSSCAKFIECNDVDLSYPDYFAQRLVEAWGMLTKAGGSFATLVKTEYISKWLLHMIRHTFLTLHHSSPAMQVMGTSNPLIGEYISAMVSVLLAVLYLLLLLEILIALGKIVQLIGKTLWLMWVPTRMVISLFKWCIFS